MQCKLLQWPLLQPLKLYQLEIALNSVTQSIANFEVEEDYSSTHSLQFGGNIQVKYELDWWEGESLRVILSR